MGPVAVGIDIGKKRDPTAIAVTEAESRPGPRGPEDHHLVRFLERLPLGTPYPRVAARLEEIVTGIRQRLNRSWPGPPLPRPVLSLRTYVDATGVGQPVVDALRAANVDVVAVYFTHGDRRTEEGNQVTLGKAYLVSQLKSLFQAERVHLPATSEALAMKRELMDYELRVSEDANDRYGAFKTGTHDDLVTALGLAVQAPPRGVLQPVDPDFAAALADLLAVR